LQGAFFRINWLSTPLTNTRIMENLESNVMPGSAEPAEAAANEAEANVQPNDAPVNDGPFAHLEAKRRAKDIVQVRVLKWQKNGLICELEGDGTPAYMPNNQIDLNPDRNIADYFGKTVPARITRVKVDGNTAEVNVSHRSVLEDDLRNVSKERLDSIKAGDVLDVKVKAFNIKDVIVDLGPGIDAFIRGRDLTWEEFDHPYEIVKRGETLQAKVLQVDKKHRKVQLGVRQLTADPYQEKFEKIKPETTMSATVVSINDFGAEVDLGDDVIAFLPISEIDWERIPSVAAVLKLDDTFDVKILTVDDKKRRITCSKKRLVENPLRVKEEKYRMGTDHNGTIKEVNRGGVIVVFEDGTEGFIPRRELSHDRIERLEDVFKKDKPLENLRVIDHDRRNGQLTFSLIAAEREAQRTTLRQYRASSKAATFGIADQLAALKEKLEANN
jgi:small subunit ribosomal protein S1